VAPQGEDPFPVFRDFIHANQGENREADSRTRVTNTNEVGRSAMLHPGFASSSILAECPFHLIEIGPSAGLNMIWDRYGVRYHERRTRSCAAFRPMRALIGLRVARRRNSALGCGAARRKPPGSRAQSVDLTTPTTATGCCAGVAGSGFASAPSRTAMELFIGERRLSCTATRLNSWPMHWPKVPEDETVASTTPLRVYQFSTAMKEALESILTVAGLAPRSSGALPSNSTATNAVFVADQLSRRRAQMNGSLPMPSTRHLDKWLA